MQGVTILSTDLTRLANDSVTGESRVLALTQQISQSNESLREKDPSLTRIRADQETVENDLSFLRQQFDTRPSDSHDGTFHWKIDGVQQKIGQSDRQSLEKTE